MAKIAYFDIFSGISGDMTIAAFLDAGLKMDLLVRELARLKIGGYELKKSAVRRGTIAGTRFECIAKDKSCRHRPLKEIIAIIDKSSLSAKVKKTAKDIFGEIGKAEARVHGIKQAGGSVLHELGDIDSIIDIVGTAIAVDSLGIEKVYSSKVEMGRGFTESAHGRLPLPAPATIEILKNVPLSICETQGEFVTPTGAGIIKTLSSSFGRMPELDMSSIGYGAGSRELPDRPNLLRVLIGESRESFRTDKVYVIESNIDDMNPQVFERVFEELFTEGALDVWLESIIMKKSRPGFRLSVITARAGLERMASVIFRETSTIGLRFYEADRFKLERKLVRVDTRYGKVKVKLSASRSGAATISPEYDECARLAKTRNVPFKNVYDEAKAAAIGER